jgi:hypothetical protein
MGQPRSTPRITVTLVLISTSRFLETPHYQLSGAEFLIFINDFGKCKMLLRHRMTFIGVAYNFFREKKEKKILTYKLIIQI